jgi:hypothetical protein
MKAILKRFDEEHPSLWEGPGQTLFNNQCPEQERDQNQF